MLDTIRATRTSGTGRSGRKRKRRSHQPKKDRDRRRRWIVVVAIGIGAPLVVSLFLAILWEKTHVESEPFRRDLNRRLTELIGAETDVGTLSLQGLLLSAQRVRIRGGENQFIHSAELRQVEARIILSSFFGNQWKLDSLTVEECDVQVGAGSAGAAGANRESHRIEDASLPATMRSGIGLSSDPGSCWIGSVQVREFNLSWGDSENEAGGKLERSRIYSASLSQSRLIRMVGGDIVGTEIGSELESADLRWDKGKLIVESAIIRVQPPEVGQEDESTMELSGALRLDSGETLDLNVVLTNVDLGLLLSNALKNNIGGLTQGSLQYRQEWAGNGGESVWDGRLDIAEASLRDLDVLNRLAIFTEETRFRRIDFPDAIKVAVHRQGGRLTVDVLEAVQPGLIRITGKVVVGDDDTLSGELSVGLPEALLARLPGGKPGFFGEPSGGFAFTTVRPSGTLAFPAEDLSARLNDLIRAQSALDSRPAPLTSPTRVPGARDEDLPGDALPGKEPYPLSPSAPGLNDEHARIEALFDALLKN